MDASLATASHSVDRDLVVRLTRDLVRIRSVNPPGNEREAAEYLGNEMHALGLEVELHHLEPDRSQVIGRIRGSGSGHLVLTGHLDVVPPGGQDWQHDPFGAEVVDGRIYGRGSTDMKGGVAAIVAGAAALVAGGFQPRADYVIAATLGEEAGMVGAAAMVEKRSLDGSAYLVVAEPSSLDVFVGEKGVLWLEVRAFGRTAHGAMPWLGVNAVICLSRLISRLDGYPFAFVESPLLGKPSISPNVIEGGNKTNVVPDSCRLELDLRTVPGQDHAAMVEEIRTIASEVAGELSSEARLEVKILQDVAPLETDQTDPLVDATLKAVKVVRGTSPAVGGVAYGTDAAHLSPGFGLPMVICGPGNPGMCHQPDEYVEIEELVQAAQIYVELARSLLG
jgi:succinyl-diaminopimelate desuccinylase